MILLVSGSHTDCSRAMEVLVHRELSNLLLAEGRFGFFRREKEEARKAGRRFIEKVVEGDATGVDHFAKEWAKEMDIPLGTYPAKWTHHGRAAGPIRNLEMLVNEKPCTLLAFPGEESIGTFDMIRQARRQIAHNRIFIITQSRGDL